MRIFQSPNPISRIRLIIPIFLLTVFSAVLINLTGCKEDSNILGRDILPSGDDLLVKIDSSVVISAYTITGKHIITTANNYYPIGSLRDSIFGFSTAGIVAQFAPVSLLPPSSIINIDSMILTLGKTSAYGDSLTSQTVRVYEMNEKLYWDSSYYSDYNISGKYFPTELGSANFAPKDTVIRISLTNYDYINQFIGQPDSVFEKEVNFLNVFKGYYIKPDSVSQGGGFASISSKSVNTRLDMYYNGGSTGGASSLYTMYFDSYTAKFNVYNHYYTGFPVSKNLNVQGSNDSVLFVEGLAGVSIRLSFPQLNTFLQSKTKKYAINKASLIVPVENLALGNVPESNYPVRLMLFQLKNNGDYNYVYDFKINEAYFNGTYNKAKKAFVFNIGLHLQSYLSGKIENSDLILVSYSSNESPKRAVLGGAGGIKSKIKLMVTYTEL
jgi:hypothetical protein